MPDVAQRSGHMWDPRTDHDRPWKRIDEEGKRTLRRGGFSVEAVQHPGNRVARPGRPRSPPERGELTARNWRQGCRHNPHAGSVRYVAQPSWLRVRGASLLPVDAGACPTL